MAFNIDYNQVSKLLLAKAKEKRKSQWNILKVYEPVIYDLGGEKGRIPEEPIQVADFIDQYVLTGVCIMETNGKPEKYGYGNHLTCCVNGTLYDSWDSSDQYVCQYYLINDVSHEFTDIGDHLDALIDEGEQLVGQLWQKYQAKYNLPGQFTNIGSRKKTEFSFYFRLEYKDDSVRDVHDLACVFTPTMSVDEARKKMAETIKIRMYDRFYAINQKRKQSSEGDSLFYESGYTENDKRNLYLDSRERRFFDSLPGWIKPFIVYVNIQDPGQYSDSYQLEALPIKGDPRRKNVTFYGYNSADVKDEIARYRKNFERVDDDYSYYEEY